MSSNVRKSAAVPFILLRAVTTPGPCGAKFSRFSLVPCSVSDISSRLFTDGAAGEASPLRLRGIGTGATSESVLRLLGSSTSASDSDLSFVESLSVPLRLQAPSLDSSSSPDDLFPSTSDTALSTSAGSKSYKTSTRQTV